MKFKHLAIVVGMCTLFMIASFLSKRASQKGEYENVFDGFNPDKVSSIIIRDHNGAVFLSRTEANWKVDSSDQYPANNQKITNFLENLRTIKSDGNFEISDDLFDRFEINDPEKKKEKSGLKISFFDDQGKSIQTIIIGKKAETKAIQYLYSIDKNILAKALYSFEENANPNYWLNVFFLEFKDIIRITKQADKSSWALTRNDPKNEFTLNIEGTYTPNTSNINNLEETLLNITFNDVIKNTNTADLNLSFNNKISVREENGFEYHLSYTDQNQDNIYLQLEFTGTINEERSEELTEAEIQSLSKTLEQRINQLENRFNGWTFILSKKDHQALFFQLENLADDIKLENDGFETSFDIPEITPDEED